MTPRIVLAGGGTAGHVNPLLATAFELQNRGCEVVVLGTSEGLEASLVPSEGLDFLTVPRVPFPRTPTIDVFTLPLRLRRATQLTAAIIHDADAVIGFGGYVATPAYRAAAQLKIPFAIHEQNARPGLANRMGAVSARLVALTFEETALKARKGITEVVGLPLRRQISELAQLRSDRHDRQQAREQAATALGVDPQKKTLVITGGSLGAVHINEVVCQAASSLPQGSQVIHLAGRGKDQQVREAIAAAGVGDRWKIIDYTNDIGSVFAVADLVLARSGAGTVAELMALGLPAFYVPLPIGNGEQRLNARVHTRSGGAALVDNDSFNAETMRSRVFPLLTSPRLEMMAAATARIARTDATSRLSDLVMEMISNE